MNWWALPGPRSFVDTVIQDVRDGKSVFISLPEHCPGRLSSCLKEALQEDFRWLALNVDPETDPLEYLYDFCAPDADRRRLRSIQSLTSERSFQGQVIWLQDLCSTDWGTWSRFFIEYERISRAVSVSRRTYFVIPLVGAACACDIPQGVGIASRKWDGWLRRGDMLLYSASSSKDQEFTVEGELTAALVTTLAGWDPGLCEWLAQLNLQQLLTPKNALQEFAENRGWDLKDEVNVERAWTLGLWQTFHAKTTPHTCVAALTNGSGVLDQLIWKAEIGVLMPYIEEQRQGIIQQYRSHFQLPFTTKSGEEINNIYDLEIGLIEYQLSRCSSVTFKERKRISDLKDARNALSHLEPVDPALLLTICASEAGR